MSQAVVTNSLLESLYSLSEENRQQVLKGLSEAEAADVLHDWRGIWARPNQLAPAGNWAIWLILTGRGWGKTRTGAEWVREQVEMGRARRVAIVGETAADSRDVMVEGESGILAVSHPLFRPRYEPSKRRLTWPNGAIATTYSADDPEQLRGPQHDLGWCDEMAKWRRMETWDNFLLGLRLGLDPRALVTTTPRPIPALKGMIKDTNVVVTRGTTYENLRNLSPTFQRQVVARYEGTRLGRQELQGEVLEFMPGALWTSQRIEELRVQAPPSLSRIVVAIDPAVTAEEDSDETGIVVAGVGYCSCLGMEEEHGFVLGDLSGRYSPDAWARRAIGAYSEAQADRIIGEVNNGGEMVEYTLRTVDRSVSYQAVHASRGKQARAEPIAALYEQGKVHHIGMFPQLEDQMCQWVPGMASPDRMDALVWALTELMLGGGELRLRYL